MDDKIQAASQSLGPARWMEGRTQVFLRFLGSYGWAPGSEDGAWVNPSSCGQADKEAA